jgi:MAF protein
LSVTKLLLASNSPRRRELLSLTGWDFRVLPADIDETQRPEEDPCDYAMRMAIEKARAAAPHAAEDEIVVAADTVVVDGGAILGKPATPEEAARTLRILRGHVHQVYTALAALRPVDQVMVTDLCETEVRMRAYTDAEIEDYVSSGDPMDKAGAYGIQHRDFNPVENVAGCYASVMGLPLCHLARTLRRLGQPPRTDVPATCQAALSYDCPVFENIFPPLSGL